MAIGSTSVIVDDFDIVRVSVAKYEADAPGSVHGHGPLLAPPPLEFVEANALQLTEPLERDRGIQCPQPQPGFGVVKRGERPYAIAPIDFFACRVLPAADQAPWVLRIT